MTGYMFIIGPCVACGRPFTYNAERVPSIVVTWTAAGPVDDPNGRREPICRSCVDTANPLRIANGLDPITVLPGAYDPEEA